MSVHKWPLLGARDGRVVHSHGDALAAGPPARTEASRAKHDRVAIRTKGVVCGTPPRPARSGASMTHDDRPPSRRNDAMTDLPAPTTAYLEPEAKKLAEDTDPHPRIYELPPAPTTPRRSSPSSPTPSSTATW
ncbi:hypothetical protein GCM10027070_20140 [Barrientosiimonas humi]